MTVSENKARLDDHAGRLREVELRVGRNGLVPEQICLERRKALEDRMDKLDDAVAQIRADSRKTLVAVLVAILVVLGGVVANLAIR